LVEEMASARLQELEEMAETLIAIARKLPPGQDRDDALLEIGRFRGQIAALKGPDLRPVRQGPNAKGK
jgi:hypothetical protein